MIGTIPENVTIVGRGTSKVKENKMTCIHCGAEAVPDSSPAECAVCMRAWDITKVDIEAEQDYEDMCLREIEHDIAYPPIQQDRKE